MEDENVRLKYKVKDYLSARVGDKNELRTVIIQGYYDMDEKTYLIVSANQTSLKGRKNIVTLFFLDPDNISTIDKIFQNE